MIFIHLHSNIVWISNTPAGIKLLASDRSVRLITLECNLTKKIYCVFSCIIIPMSHILCLSKLNGIYRIVFQISYFFRYPNSYFISSGHSGCHTSLYGIFCSLVRFLIGSRNPALRITAASTPQSEEFGYVFKNCKLTAAPGVKKVYLGRPWRPYAATVFINCEFGNHIRPEGWHNWKNPENEKTARYAEFGNTGAGADASGRVAWAKQLTNKEAMKYTPQNIFKESSNWYPYK